MADRLGILTGSLISALVGWALLYRATRNIVVTPPLKADN